MDYISNKVIVITGAASGFGKLTAEKLSKMGGRIILADINEEGVNEVSAGINDAGGDAAGIVTDVRDREQVEKMADFALEKFGRIDVLVNNAGIMPHSKFESKSFDAWNRCIDINLKGAMYGITAVLDQMLKHEAGHIINISSLYGFNTHVGAGVYSATKAGLKMLSDALRAETRGKIKVSTIYPSGAATNLFSTVIDFEAASEFMGKHIDEITRRMEENPDIMTNPDMNDPKAMVLSAEAISDTIIYCINQPAGITISDITIRATNESMVY